MSDLKYNINGINRAREEGFYNGWIYGLAVGFMVGGLVMVVL